MSVKEALEPIIKYALAKYVDKGEDAWTQQPAAEATLGDENGATTFTQDAVLPAALCITLDVVLCPSCT